MSTNDQMTRIIETALESQRKSQADSNSMVIRIVELLSSKNNGKRHTHHQCKAIATIAEQAGADPKRKCRNWKAKGGANGHGNAQTMMHEPSGSNNNSATTVTEWPNINFGTPLTDDTPLSLIPTPNGPKHSLLNLSQLLAPKYTPNHPTNSTDNMDTLNLPMQVLNPAANPSEHPMQTVPAQSASANLATQPEASLNTSHIPAQKPPILMQCSQEEEELDYEDYNMDTTEGGIRNN
ncbi:hypothetical protein FRC11_012511 [Ceratobasidium sp. 423]|nr:hypothetical protein FRC11_012511 [Ceratobasidium sp. 423]